MNYADLHSSALALPLDERAALARELLLSIEEASADTEFEQVWAAESLSRATRADAASDTGSTAEAVAAKACSLLR